MRVAWITGASSGIGAACVVTAPPETRTVSVARRASPSGEELRLDLSLPEAWGTLLGDVRARLATGEVTEASFVHLAGAVGALGDAVDADPAEYKAAFFVNAGSTLALGQGFLAACREHGVPGTFVACTSPGATLVLPGMAQYCAGKAAVEKWVETVAVELQDDPGLRVLAVNPHAVDTAMVRDVMAATDVEVSGYFSDLEGKGQLATPELAAQHLWEALADPTCGPVVPIGARWLVEQPAGTS